MTVMLLLIHREINCCDMLTPVRAACVGYWIFLAGVKLVSSFFLFFPLLFAIKAETMSYRSIDIIFHLSFYQGVRIGMVVNDMADVNVDAKLVRDDPNAQGTGADSVELQNGCICW